MGLRAPRRRTAWIGVGVTTLLLAAAATAAAVPIRGSVRGADELGEAPGSQGYWSVRNGFIAVADDKRSADRELAVVLTGEPQGDPIGCTYRFDGGDLMPRTLVAKANTTLRIENRDGCAHELYAEGLADFTAISTAPGNARTVPITAGSWPLADELYGHVEGHLHAIPDLVACGTVDARGGIAFEDVPPGTYTLKIFRLAAEVASQEVVVPESGQLNIEQPIALSSGSSE